MADPTLRDLMNIVTEQTAVLKDVLQRVKQLENVITSKLIICDSARSVNSEIAVTAGRSSVIPNTSERAAEDASELFRPPLELTVCAPPLLTSEFTSIAERPAEGTSKQCRPPVSASAQLSLPDSFPSLPAVVNKTINNTREMLPVIRKITTRSATKTQVAGKMDVGVQSSTSPASQIVSASLLKITQQPSTSTAIDSSAPITKVKKFPPSLPPTPVTSDAPTTRETVTADAVISQPSCPSKPSEWIKITNKRRVTVRGSKKTCATEAPTNIFFHCYPLHPDTSCDDMSLYLNSLVNTVSFAIAKIKSKGEYSSFKIGMPQSAVAEVLKSKHWPRGTFIKEWQVRLAAPRLPAVVVGNS